MRKLLLIGVLGILILQGAFADSLTIDTEHYDARVLGLSTAYTAIADDSNSLYMNPAGLRRQYRNTMSLRIDLQDSAAGDLIGDQELSGMLVDPEVEGEFLYTTRNFGVALYSKYFLHVDYETDEYLFDVAKYNSLVVGFSTGLGPISLGVNAKATKLNERNGIDIPTGDVMEVLLPFLQEVILGEYTSSYGSQEQVMLGAGALIDLGNFSVGLYSDQFLDFMYGENSDEIHLDFVDIYEGLNVGLAYQSDTYDARGNYRVLQFTVAADVHDLGDGDSREFALGCETNLRFFEYMQMALRLGFRQDLPELDDLMFGLSLTDGDYSAGLGLVLPFMKLDAAVQVPTDAIRYAIDQDEAYSGSDIEAQLTFGFSL